MFVEAGFDAVSLSRIASAAGVTSTTIYWYFDGKDDLLVAVLDDLLSTSLERYAGLGESTLGERIVWVVEELRALSSLVDTVHSRRTTSPAIDRWHDGFHAMADQLIGAEMSPDLSEEIVTARCRMATFIVEGLVTHAIDPSGTRDIAESLATAIGGEHSRP